MSILAQSGHEPVEKIRTILPSEWGVPRPAGLSYSGDFDQLFLLDKSNADQSTSEGSTIVTITPLEDLVSTVTLGFVVDDAINTAYDDIGERLLLLNNELEELAQIEVGDNGILDTATQARFDVSRLGLEDTQGMDVDSAREHLFILDSAASQVMRVALDAEFGLDNAAISIIDLSHLGVTDLRGIAVHPASHDLFVLSPTEQKLYELTQSSGQLVTRYDVTNLDLTDPRGLVFAPSADLTDSADTIHLFIADTNLPDNQLGRILEVALDPSRCSSPTQPTTVQRYRTFLVLIASPPPVSAQRPQRAGFWTGDRRILIRREPMRKSVR